MIPAGKLTQDDLERLAFLYGGQIVVDVAANTRALVGAVMDGRRVTLGPVAVDELAVS